MTFSISKVVKVFVVVKWLGVSEALCKLSAYADALLILAEGPSRTVLHQLGESRLHQVTEWGQRDDGSVSRE